MITVKWVEKYDRCGNPVILMVGKDDVTQINEHRAAGEGDKWYYDVVYRNGGAILRVFNPISSYMEESPQEIAEEPQAQQPSAAGSPLRGKPRGVHIDDLIAGTDAIEA